MARTCRVAVMARAPIPGETKRRLIPAIGADRAADLHRAMIRRSVMTALASGIGPVELWCTPNLDHDAFLSLREEMEIELRLQRGPDLGARMLAAAEAQPGPTVVIGTDCPFLDPLDLTRAADVLHGADADVVVAPALDGGYVLIATGRPRPKLFTGVEWGTGRVLAQTRVRARAARLRLLELDARRDVDRPEDLEALTGVLSY